MTLGYVSDDPSPRLDPTAMGRLLTAYEAGADEGLRKLGINAPRVRQWAHRGEKTGLVRQDTDRRRSPLYFEADLIALAEGRRIFDEAGERLVLGMP